MTVYLSLWPGGARSVQARPKRDYCSRLGCVCTGLRPASKVIGISRLEQRAWSAIARSSEPPQTLFRVHTHIVRKAGSIRTSVISPPLWSGMAASPVASVSRSASSLGLAVNLSARIPCRSRESRWEDNLNPSVTQSKSLAHSWLSLCVIDLGEALLRDLSGECAMCYGKLYLL